MTYEDPRPDWWPTLEYFAHEVLRVGLAGDVFLILLALAFFLLINGVWLLWPEFRPRRAAELWLSATGGVLLAAICSGAWVILVCRRTALLAVLAESRAADGGAFEAVESAVSAVKLGAMSVLCVVPPLCLVVLVRWRGLTARALTLSCASMVLYTAWAALEQNKYIISNVGCGDPVALIDIPHDVFIEGQGLLQRSSEGVMLVAAVGLFLCLVAAARDTRLDLEISPRSTRHAAAIFALGLLGFVLTRPAARDARASVPHRRYFDRCQLLEPAELPRARACTRIPELPLIEVLPHGLAIDGAMLEPNQLGKLLDNKRKLFEQINPGKTLPKFDHVILAVSAKAEPAGMARGLSELARSGIRGIAIVLRRETVMIPSATLGQFPSRATCCSVAVEFVSQGTPLTAYATWKDLTRAAEAAAAGGHTLALGF